MSKKKGLVGLINLKRDKPRKRPGRHSKRPNKAFKRMNKKKYRGQGRWKKIQR